MIKLVAMLLGILLTTWSYSAELLQSGSGYNSQDKAENCIVNYCSVESAISEDTNCEEICRKCAAEAEQEYGPKSEECNELDL